MSFIAFIKRFSPAVFMLILSCIEPYDPPVKQNVADILVVEGFMNATTGTATVKLSHTMPISDTHEPVGELNASVSIKSSTGVSYILTEQDSGKYTVKGLTIDDNTRYILHIKTKLGTEFVSDSVQVKKTPPIDSLNFGISGDGQSLTILVTTHDPLNKARYYRWDYSETYEYNAVFFSGFHLRNGLLFYRKQEEQVYTCWLTLPSPTISIGTTTGLEQDIISRHLLTYVPKTSPKISVRYSILVKQMAISKEEYIYLSQLRNTTEGLGSIFGTLPFSVTGNIHQVGNAEATVLGYFSGAEVTEKRFFVERLQLPEHLRVPPSKKGCMMEQTCDLNPPPPPPSTGPPSLGPPPCVQREIVSSSSIVISAEHDGYPPFFTFTSPGCGDCRSQGGVTKKPEFW